MNDLKVLQHKWFNSSACIGVIFAVDEKYDMYHGYIGVGKGYSEQADIKFIIDHGCRLTQNETLAMIGSEASQDLIRSIPNEKWKS